MISFEKGQDIVIPIRLEDIDGDGVTGLATADLTVKVANKDSADWETLLSDDSQFLLNELSEGDYSLTILAAVNDTYEHLRIKVEDEDSAATAVVKQYVVWINKVGVPIALDGGIAEIQGMLTKLADDNNGVDFNASTDSQKALAQALSNVTNTGSAINQSSNANSTLTTGSTLTGGYLNTIPLDSVYWTINDAAGTLDMYFEFDVGATGVPVSVTWTGYLNGNNDQLSVYGYDWVGAGWVKVGDVLGKAASTNEVNSYDLFTGMVGTGVDAGKVRIRFEDTGLTTATFATDQVFVSYSVAQSPVGYANGQIWIDTINGTTGSVAGVNGVADLPVDNWADALTLAGSTGLRRFKILQGSLITLTGTLSNYELSGLDYILVLNGQQLDNVIITGAVLSGIATGNSGSVLLMSCIFGGTTTLPECSCIDCALAADITLGEVGTYTFERCFSVVAGGATPCLDVGAAIADTNVNFRHYSGGIEIENLGQLGTDKMSLEGWGQFVLNSNCIGGELEVRGHFKKTDNSGAVTISEEVNFKSNIVTFGRAQGAGTGNNQIQLATDASAVDGSYDPSMVFIVTGTGAGQTRLVLQYDGTSKIATVDRNWKVNPDTTSEYRIVAHAGREHVNEGLAQAGGASTITLNTLASTDNNAYNNQLVFLRSGTGEDQVRFVSSYVGATKVATVDRAWDVVPDSTTGYVILPAHAENTEATALAAITSYDPPTNTEMLAAFSTTDGLIAAVDVLSTAIKAVTDLIPDGGAMNDLAAILVDTGTDIPAQITALNDLSQSEAETACGTALTAYDGPTYAEMMASFSTTDGLINAVGVITTAIKAVTDLIPDAGAMSDLATILVDTGTTLPAQIAALNNLSQAQVETACDTALASYDGPTNAEMTARTLAAAEYATALSVAAVQTDVTIIRKLRQNRLEIDLTVSKAYVWNDAGLARELESTLTDNAGADVTTTTQGPINATAWTAI